MSDNIATLGLSVDSSSVKTATAALQGLQVAAGQTSSAVASLTAAAAPAAAAANSLATASNTASNAHSGFSTQAMAASHSVRSLVESLVAGASPTQALALQLNHLSYAASGPGGLSGAFGELAGTLGKFINPMTLAAAGLVGIGIAAAVTYNNIKNTELEFGNLADRAGTTAAALHALSSAAAIKGIDSADFLKVMQDFSDRVTDAQHGLGSLAELLRANNQTAGDFGTTFGKIGDLIKNSANDQERYRIITQAGLPATQQWVSFLSQGAAGIKAATDAAVQFGTVADASLIQRARMANEEWNKTWANFKDAGSAAFITITDKLAGFADAYQGLLIKLGANPISLLSTAFQTGNGSRLSNATSPTGQIVSGSDTGGFYKGIGAFNPSPTKNPVDLKKDIQDQQQLIGLLGQQATVDDIVKQKENEIALARLNGVSVTKQQEQAILAYTRAQTLGVTAIQQQTDDQRIAATTVNMSVGATAAYTAVQQRVNEALIRGAPLRKDQIADLEKEAKALGAATQAAAELRVKSDAAFATSQLGRTDADQQVASTLRGFLGDKYTEQMDGAIASTIRFNAVLSDTKNTAQSALSGFFNDLVQGKSAADALRGSLQTIEKKLIDMATNALLSNLFKNLISAGLGGGAGGGAGGIPLPALTGGFHSGGIIGAGSGVMRSVSPFAFIGAPRFHDGGMVSDEVPAILREGEGVFTQGQMKALGLAASSGGSGGGSAGPRTEVHVYNNAPNSTVETRKSSQGGVDVHEITIKAVDSAMASGRFDGTMRARYNNQVQPRSR